MRTTIRINLILSLFACMFIFSCDDEPVDNNILNTIETIVPNSQLANLMEDITIGDFVQCVDFQYPLTFTVYSINFQVIETVTIQNDADLQVFLQNLGNGDNGTLLVSLDFPVTLIYDNGTSVVVHNNQELEEAIVSATDHCGNAQSCEQQNVRDYLISCPQVPTLNGNTPLLTVFEFYDSNELFTLFQQDLALLGTWDIAVIDGEIRVFINFEDLEGYNGEWTVVDCSETTLVLREGNDVLFLNSQCQNTGSFECFGSFDAQLTVCDDLNDGVETFDLTQAFANCTTASGIEVSYHMSEADAQSGINALANPMAYTNTSNPETVFVRVELMANGSYQIYPIQLILEVCDCDNPGILANGLAMYMPFANQAIDLISDYEVTGTSNAYVADRDTNSTCAVAFSGNQGFSVPVTAQNQLLQGDGFSISLWFKMQNDNPSNLEVFFQKGNANSSQGFVFGVYDLNKPVIYDKSGTFSLWEENVDLTNDTEWHHLVVTVDENNTVRLFRNGVQRNIMENSNFNIGSDALENFVLGEGFEGHLDDLRVYKRSLSPNEVTELYNLSGECYQCF